MDGMVTALHLNVGHRVPLKDILRARFIAEQGIEGDRHSTAMPERRDYQVLVMDQETLAMLGLAPGDVRENVTTKGLNLTGMLPGQKLALGREIILRLSKPCAPCSRMDELRPGLQQELEGRRGMLAVVERGGTVAVGDSARALGDSV